MQISSATKSYSSPPQLYLQETRLRNLLDSIVAVHGLNQRNIDSHAEKTWTATSTEKLWLRDFLPLRLKQARILLFGYNYNVAFSTSETGVRDQAGNIHNPKPTFLNALEKDSLFAEELAEYFKHQLEDYHVLSFYESLLYKNNGIVRFDLFSFSKICCIIRN